MWYSKPLLQVHTMSYTQISSSPSTNKRDRTRERVLEAAALEMNLMGTASLNLMAVGKAVGMSRNALYHYVKNRDDLIYQTYLQSVEALADNLTEARNCEGTATGQLRRLIETQLAVDRREQVVLKNTDALPPAQRDTIERLNNSNVQTICGILIHGMRSGEFRQIDPVIATQVLLGLMDWAQLWYRFTYGSSTKAIEKRAAAASVIEQIMFKGIAASLSWLPAEAPDLAHITASTFDIFDGEYINERKRLRVIGAASGLFAGRGIEPTSLDDVAAAIKSTKGAVYHYFDNKTDLLLACYERTFDLFDLYINSAKANTDNPLDELLVILNLHCQAHASPYPPLVPLARLSSLPALQAERVVAITQRLYKIQQAAVANESCRIESPAVIDLSLGASVWVNKWLSDNPGVDARNLASTVCSIYSGGVLAG